MREAGEPLPLQVVKGPYGPHVQDLQHLLRGMQGRYLVEITGDDEPLELLPEALREARAKLAATPDTNARVERVGRLIDGFESSFGLELLGTVDWVIRHEHATLEQQVIDRTYEWGERKRQFSRRQVLLAREVLTELGWVDTAV